jgi:predicted Zn-dependent protease with MMP-like domain
MCLLRDRGRANRVAEVIAEGCSRAAARSSQAITSAGRGAAGRTPRRGRRARPRLPGEKETPLTRPQFEALVDEAFRAIPRRFRQRLRNVAVMVEDEPSPELLAEMEIEPPDTLFGLYQGTPLTSRQWDFGNQLPDRIVIFQRPIEDACDDEEEVLGTITETLIHEAGHYFGMTEEQIEEIEERYWRGEDVEDLIAAGGESDEGGTAGS